MRTVYLGTSEFAAAVLERLAASPHRPELVVTRPDSPRGRGRRVTPPPVALTARELGIEVDQAASVNDADARARIAQAAPDVVVVCAFGALIKEELLAAHRILNVHPALLPKFGGHGMYGAHVHTAVLKAGETESGVTIHLVDDAYDHGAVVAQTSVPVHAGDTPETLAARVQAREQTLYPEVLARIFSGEIDLDRLAPPHH